MSKKQELLLLKLDDDWADEMDIHAFRIVTKSLWEHVKHVSELHDENEDDDEYEPYEFEISIGTNESLTYDSAIEWYNKVTTKEITEEEAITFINLFGLGVYHEGYGQSCLDLEVFYYDPNFRSYARFSKQYEQSLKDLSEMVSESNDYIFGVYYDYHK